MTARKLFDERFNTAPGRLSPVRARVSRRRHRGVHLPLCFPQRKVQLCPPIGADGVHRRAAARASGGGAAGTVADRTIDGVEAGARALHSGGRRTGAGSAPALAATLAPLDDRLEDAGLLGLRHVDQFQWPSRRSRKCESLSVCEHRHLYVYVWSEGDLLAEEFDVSVALWTCHMPGELGQQPLLVLPTSETVLSLMLREGLQVKISRLF